MADKIVEFTGRVIRQIWANEENSFRIYAFDVDQKTIEDQGLKKTMYGSISVKGTVHELGQDLDYNIKAKETYDAKNGYSYQLINISRNRPQNSEEMYYFLREIITKDQADELWRNYPNIVQKIIDDDLDDIDLNKTKGIKEARFEVIKRKVIENYALAEMVIEFKGLLSMSMIQKLYDKYSSVKLLRSELKSDPYVALCRLNGVGFKTADSIILELEQEKIIDFGYDLKTSKQRCLGAVLYLLEKNENDGNTCINIKDLRTNIIKLVPLCADKFVEALKSEHVYYDKDKMICSLKSTFETEKYIAENIKERLNIKSNIWNYDVEKYRNIDGINLSDEQMGLLKAVCENNFVVLTAPGGCGKSFSTKALINMLVDNCKEFKLASPTGKAAKKLASYTGRDAETIHRMLCYKNGHFQYNEDNQLCTDVLLIDEIGMTDIRLLKSLLEATNMNTKVVFIGDEFQLNSVGAGAALRDLISCSKIPHVKFTKVYRMGEGGVLTACTYVRQNKKFLTDNKFTQIGTDKSYSFIPANKDNINNMIVELYKKLLKTNDPKDITVIAAYNVGSNGCDILNSILQPIANPNAKLNNKHVITTQDKNKVSFYEGDNVIANVNNYKANVCINGELTGEKCLICNGESGVVKQIKDNGLVIDFDGVEVYYAYSELGSIRHAFALSVFKMQGSQSKNIIFSCCSAHTYMLNNNIVYTALSRAEKNAYHFGDVKTINYAMSKSDNKKRQTWLGDLLNGNMKGATNNG